MGGSVLQWYAYCIVRIVFQWAGIVFKWIIYLWTTILWRCFLSDRSGWFGLLTARNDISEVGIFVVYLKAFRATGSSSATGQKDKRSTTMNSFHFPFLTGSRPVH